MLKKTFFYLYKEFNLPFSLIFFCQEKSTLSRLRSLPYKNQSIDLQSKLKDWFLYVSDLRYERVNFSW